MSNALLITAKSVRQMVIQLVQSIPEDLYDVQPQQFNNTIRWNIGHIVFAHDYFLSIALPFSSNLPGNYTTLFNTGTTPSEWTIIPPTKEELIQNLSGQLDKISEVSLGTLDKELKSPIEMGPLKFETTGEVFNFATVHEAMHFTTISSLLKVLNYQI
ncbi:hypothetical protein J2Y03_004779 [Neobacillus niacini]|uniref:DinB family protein n=1 Tax=Neobacillus niacini TaxID=86668 RepID=UPI0028604A4A|nr:DinB family protein [Neobacillus niacini]MDR7079721.1 hypothetical protein [Neobacillus niacini]